MKEKSSWSLADLIIPMMGFILSVYYLITIRGIPFMAQMYGGSISAVLMVLSLVVFGVAIRSGVLKNIREKAANLKKNWRSDENKVYIRVAIMVILISLYIVLVPLLGYPVTSMLFMCTVMYFLGMRKIKTNLLTALFVTALGFGLFVLFLKVSLPLDPVSQSIARFFW